MFNKLTNKEIRNILFDPEFYGACEETCNFLEEELFNRTGSYE
jgi:hypothetical protein